MVVNRSVEQGRPPSGEVRHRRHQPATAEKIDRRIPPERVLVVDELMGTQEGGWCGLHAFPVDGSEAKIVEATRRTNRRSEAGCGELFDDLAEQHVTRIAVRERRTGNEECGTAGGQRELLQRGPLVSSPRGTVNRRELIGLGEVHQPAAMLEQLSYGDRLAVTVLRQQRRNLRWCNLDRRLVQVDQTAIGKVENRRSDERLRARRNPHCMIGGHGTAHCWIRLPPRHGGSTVRSIDCNAHGGNTRCSSQELLDP